MPDGHRFDLGKHAFARLQFQAADGPICHLGKQALITDAEANKCDRRVHDVNLLHDRAQHVEYRGC